MRIHRNAREYALAIRVVHLENALQIANNLLNKDGKLGVLASRSIRFRDGMKFHKRVRKIINQY